MNERIIIRGEKANGGGLLETAFLLDVFAILLSVFNPGNVRRGGKNFFDLLGFEGRGILGIIIPLMFYLGSLFFLIWLYLKIAFWKVSITVTDKRVYGTAAWGKRVDLPLDKISAVATSFGKGIAVATSSGAIGFKGILNNAEVHQTISRLLMERQSTASRVPMPKQPAPAALHSDADELKKFKDLLDSGVITQEEFDAKKKKILGL